MEKNYSVATVQPDTKEGKIADIIPKLRVTSTLRNPQIEEKTREENILNALLGHGYSGVEILDALQLVNVNFSIEEMDDLSVGLFVNKIYVEFMLTYREIRPQNSEQGLRIAAKYIADNHMVAKKHHGELTPDELLELHAKRKASRMAEMLKK